MENIQNNEVKYKSVRPSTESNDCSLKIFISAHKRAKTPRLPFLTLVQAGTAIATERFSDMQSDDTGENISRLNGDYCELSVMYWAWKNSQADYYGFFHYRRYLSFDGEDHRLPYRLENDVNDKLVNSTKLAGAKDFSKNYDIVLPYRESMQMSVEEFYAAARLHDIADLLLVKEIISSHYPDYAIDAKNYLSGREQFFSNMFVMKRHLFFEYCTWLFDILGRFDNLRTTSFPRADGFLAERLLGIWFEHICRTRDIKTAFVQRVDILSYFKCPLKKRMMYHLFPPSSRRRAAIKKLLK